MWIEVKSPMATLIHLNVWDCLVAFNRSPEKSDDHRNVGQQSLGYPSHA